MISLAPCPPSLAATVPAPSWLLFSMRPFGVIKLLLALRLGLGLGIMPVALETEVSPRASALAFRCLLMLWQRVCKRPCLPEPARSATSARGYCLALLTTSLESDKKIALSNHRDMLPPEVDSPGACTFQPTPTIEVSNMSTQPNPSSSSSPSACGETIHVSVAWVGFVLCFLAGAAVTWGYHQYQQRQEDQEEATVAWSDEQSPVAVSSQDPVWGDREAAVTIVQFSDFQCPFCATIEPVLSQLRALYGPKKLRIVWKNAPLSFHEQAKAAAQAAQGVFVMRGSRAFWAFHDKALQNQRSLTTENFVRWAREAGVMDVKAYKEGLGQGTWQQKVEQDLAQAKEVGVRGTPSFFINGVGFSLQRGRPPLEQFRRVIEQELKKASKAVSRGVGKGQLYVELSRENRARWVEQEREERRREQKRVVEVVEEGSSPVRGSRGAGVSIVVFSDFQCPFCRKAAETLEQLRKMYPKEVRVVWKHHPLPFHDQAEPAAQLTEEARVQRGEEGFWRAHDLLFKLGEEGGRYALGEGDMMRVAKAMGLNIKRVREAMEGHKYRERLQRDQEQARKLGVSSTPHLFVNGRRVEGAQPLEVFKRMIEEELEGGGGTKGE